MLAQGLACLSKLLKELGEPQGLRHQQQGARLGTADINSNTSLTGPVDLFLCQCTVVSTKSILTLKWLSHVDLLLNPKETVPWSNGFCSQEYSANTNSYFFIPPYQSMLGDILSSWL